MDFNKDENYYSILGADVNFSLNDIKRKYYEKKFGGDYLNLSDKDKQLLEKAYAILCNNESRLKYNEFLKRQNVNNLDTIYNSEDNVQVQTSNIIPCIPKLEPKKLIPSNSNIVMPCNKIKERYILIRKNSGTKIVNVKTEESSSIENYNNSSYEKLLNLLSSKYNDNDINLIKTRYKNKILEVQQILNTRKNNKIQKGSFIINNLKMQALWIQLNKMINNFNSIDEMITRNFKTI